MPSNSLPISLPHKTLFVGLLATAVLSAHAGIGSWTQVNSASSTFRALAIDKSGTIYYTAGANLQKSIDGGKTWVTLTGNSGFQGSQTASLATDANGNVYAGTVGSGLYKSTDGGSSWSAASNGLPFTTMPNISNKYFANIATIAIDPAGSLYVGTNAVTLVSPTTGAAIATTPSGVYKSTDGGASWNSVTAFSPISGSPSPLNFGAIAISSKGDTAFGNTSGGLYTTTNNQPSYMILSSGLYAVGYDAGGNLFAGSRSGVIYTYPNTGAAYSFTAPSFVFTLAFDKSNGVYAGTATGVVKSIDTGKSFSAFNDGLPSTSVGNLAIDPIGNIFAATSSGLYEYTPAATASVSSIAGSITGGAIALNLTANIRVAGGDVGKIGNLYTVAYYQGIFLALTANGFAPMALPDIQPYSTTTLGSHAIPVLVGFDVSKLSGLAIFAGYGIDANDMLVNAKFKQIYPAQ